MSFVLTKDSERRHTEATVAAREYQQLPAFDPNHPPKDFVTLREAAQRLDVSLTIVRRMIAEKKLPASQVITCAPWQIPAEALNSDVVRTEVENIKKGVRAPRTQQEDGQQALFS